MIADALLQKHFCLCFIAIISLVFFQMIRDGAYWHKIYHIHACAFAVQTKYSVISFGFVFRRLLWRHCKTFKFYPITEVYFTLADLFETKKVQEAKFRDCHRYISTHFASVYFDEKISRYFKAVDRIWQSKNTILFLYIIPKLHRRTTVHNLTMIDNTWKL